MPASELLTIEREINDTIVSSPSGNLIFGEIQILARKLFEIEEYDLGWDWIRYLTKNNQTIETDTYITITKSFHTLQSPKGIQLNIEKMIENNIPIDRDHYYYYCLTCISKQISFMEYLKKFLDENPLLVKAQSIQIIKNCLQNNFLDDIPEFLQQMKIWYPIFPQYKVFSIILNCLENDLDYPMKELLSNKYREVDPDIFRFFIIHLLKNKRIDDAIFVSEKILENRKNIIFYNTQVSYLIVDAYIENGELQKAADLIGDKKQYQRRATFNLIRAYVAIGDMDSARSFISELRKIRAVRYPKDLRVLFNIPEEIGSLKKLDLAYNVEDSVELLKLYFK